MLKSTLFESILPSSAGDPRAPCDSPITHSPLSSLSLSFEFSNAELSDTRAASSSPSYCSLALHATFCKPRRKDFTGVLGSFLWRRLLCLSHTHYHEATCLVVLHGSALFIKAPWTGGCLSHSPPRLTLLIRPTHTPP